MVNKNKGIATIAILGIILGVLVIGGGAYYVGINKGEDKNTKKENKIEEKEDLINQNQIKTEEYKNTDSKQISSEESVSEVFKRQPGAIKEINWDGAELSVDLLSRNPNWNTGENEEFFINQSLKIRELNVNDRTIIKNCKSQNPDYYSNFDNSLRSFTDYVQDKINKSKNDPGLLSKFGYTAYFDIEGSDITAIYEQCLP